jgi:hypothetical protein
MVADAARGSWALKRLKNIRALKGDVWRYIQRQAGRFVVATGLAAKAGEHAVGVGKALGRDGLDHVPMLDDHAVFHAEQVIEGVGLCRSIGPR